MRCSQAQRLLSLQRDDALSTRAAHALAAHLERCVACRALRQEFEALASDLRTLAAAPSEVDIVCRALLAWQSQKARPAPSQIFRSLSPLALTSALAAAVMVAIAFSAFDRSHPGKSVLLNKQNSAHEQRFDLTPRPPSLKRSFLAGKGERRAKLISFNWKRERLSPPLPRERSDRFREGGRGVRSDLMMARLQRSVRHGDDSVKVSLPPVAGAETRAIWAAISEKIGLRADARSVVGGSNMELGFVEPFHDRHRTALNFSLFHETNRRFDYSLSSTQSIQVGDNDLFKNAQRLKTTLTEIQLLRRTSRAENVTTDPLALPPQEVQVVRNSPSFALGASLSHDTRDLDLSPAPDDLHLRRDLDDRILGKRLSLSSIKFHQPISQKFKWALFPDLEDDRGESCHHFIINRFRQINGFQLHSGIDPGIHVSTSIGPLQLDYGLVDMERKVFQ